MAAAGRALAAFLVMTFSGVNTQKLALSIIPANGDVQLGEPKLYICKAVSGEASFQWLKPDGDFATEDDEEYQLQTIDESSVGLKIMLLKENQGGEVQCQAETENGEKAEQSIQIRMIQRPVITSKEKLFRELEQGSDAEMRCSATGIPMPKITWLRNGMDIEQPGDGRISITNGNLRINKVQASDSGLYSCRASIEARNEFDEINFTLSVTVPASAHFKNNSTSVMGGANSTASLICLVMGHPKPQITWSRAGKPVRATEGKYTFNSDASELKIESVDDADKGEYTCTARNKLGQALANISLEVLDVQPIVQPKGMGAGGIVGIVMVIFLVVLLIVDVSCYYTNKCGVLMCLAVNLLGKHPYGGKGHILDDRKTSEKSARCAVVNVSGIEA
ncbi:neural cell adhesion molecule 1-like [Ambystoma mexicanum]|uniref:neural cell adhesion molecule 1-like n=1 Tax=Ambystoma mexicanum TaxID=8296 RepID=UPI0037E8256B